jgi:hypothetical protein
VPSVWLCSRLSPIGARLLGLGEEFDTFLPSTSILPLFENLMWSSPNSSPKLPGDKSTANLSNDETPSSVGLGDVLEEEVNQDFLGFDVSSPMRICGMLLGGATDCESGRSLSGFIESVLG